MGEAEDLSTDSSVFHPPASQPVHTHTFILNRLPLKVIISHGMPNIVRPSRACTVGCIIMRTVDRCDRKDVRLQAR